MPIFLAFWALFYFVKGVYLKMDLLERIILLWNWMPRGELSTKFTTFGIL